MKTKLTREKGMASQGDRGFTLVELIVVVGMLVAALSMGSQALYQTLSARGTWQDNMLAVREARSAGSWFAGDAMNVQTIDLVDGGLPAGLVTLAWAGDGEELHTVVYFVADGELIRDYDGVQMAVARHVVSAGFSLSGSTLRLEIEVLGAHGATEWAMLDTYLRMLQP